jgi:hypothetical protein
VGTRFEKVACVYRTIALVFLNTLLVGVVGGGIIFLISRSKRTEPPENPLAKYGLAKLQPLYPALSPDEIVVLLNESWGRPLIYEPYTQFAEAPFRGRFVNVSEAGFRLIQDQGPWPPDKKNLNVFVFGGSTTFGYGVADGETIPSALQQKLRAQAAQRVCVYNFGRGHYYSTQERILFNSLLSADIVPDVAVFIDGVNEFYYRKDAPEYSTHLMRVVNENFLARRKPGEEAKIADIVRKSPAPGTGQVEVAMAICRRYLRSREMIEAVANARGVKTVFVWQPVPTYKFDLKFHPFADKDFGRHALSGMGYRQMALLRQTNAPRVEELWLADMQEGAREPLYVDAFHYSPKMCERIAAEIARFMSEREMLPR